MKILLVHNEYREKGGEDTVLKLEEKMLLKNGHTIKKYLESNKELKPDTMRNKISLGLNTIWSKTSFNKFCDEIERLKPDIIHVHNTFPIISPSIYKAAKKYNIPVVQTLHNYRLVCANGLLLKEGMPCELCVGKKIPYDALKNKCYKDSYASTLAVTGMQTVNKFNGNFNNNVDAFICLTDFAAKIMERDGFPKEKLYVKPNFLNNINEYIENTQSFGSKRKIIYVGKVSPEKGVEDILEALSNVESDFEFTIVGDGPDKERLMSKYSGGNIIWKGWIDQSLVKFEIQKNDFLVMGSRWYEGFPMVLLEAMSFGKPTIVPNHAGFPFIVSNENGILFEANNVNSLSKALRDAVNITAEDYQKMSIASFENIKNNYTEELNYHYLMKIYNSVISKKPKEIH